MTSISNTFEKRAKYTKGASFNGKYKTRTFEQVDQQW